MLVVSVRGQSPREWLAQAHHVYVGRRVALRSGKNAGQAWPESPLGNPFKVGRAANPLTQYEEWLRTMLATDNAGATKVQQAFAALTANSVLGCWCAPAPCHANIIAKVWLEKAPAHS